MFCRHWQPYGRSGSFLWDFVLRHAHHNRIWIQIFCHAGEVFHRLNGSLFGILYGFSIGNESHVHFSSYMPVRCGFSFYVRFWIRCLSGGLISFCYGISTNHCNLVRVSACSFGLTVLVGYYVLPNLSLLLTLCLRSYVQQQNFSSYSLCDGFERAQRQFNCRCQVFHLVQTLILLPEHVSHRVPY